jgi:hypothetical protein
MHKAEHMHLLRHVNKTTLCHETMKQLLEMKAGESFKQRDIDALWIKKKTCQAKFLLNFSFVFTAEDRANNG